MSADCIGSRVNFTKSKIVGIVTCTPSIRIENNYFLKDFTQEDINNVVKMIGVKKRYWTDDKTTTKDLCVHAGMQLLKKLNWEHSSVDVLIFVSQTPDYILPPTSIAIQAELSLSKNTIVFDVNLGCSGYVYALWLGMSLIESGSVKRVLLAVGDTISKIIDHKDRSTAMLFGDAGTVTALERSDVDEESFFILGADGLGVNNLIVPNGRFKIPSTEIKEKLKDKNLSCLYMDGSEIFNFTLRTLPSLFSEIMNFSKISISDYDYFLFHQANIFILNHIAKKIKLPLEKVPLNIEDFGNTSSASIPLLITTRLSEPLKRKSSRLALFGFGVGYSWGGASIGINEISVLEHLIYE